MNEPLESGVIWDRCGDDQAAAALDRLARQAPDSFSSATVLSARCGTLSFYRSHRLIELDLERATERERVFVLHGESSTRLLDGNSEPIHDTNVAESLVLTTETVEDYARFFLYFLRTSSGAFVLVEHPDEIAVRDAPNSNGNVGDLTTRCATLRGRVHPLATRGSDDAGRWLFDATVAYDDALFSASFAVSSDGGMEMVDDEPLDTLDGLSVPQYPSLAPLVSRESAGEASSVLRDRDVAEAIVAVLLEDAIRESDSATTGGRMLLRHFNVVTHGETVEEPVDRLTRLLVESLPVVVIESDIPFVEDFVAGLIDGPTRAVSDGAIERAVVMDGDELRCRVSYWNDMVKLHLISFHTYRGLFDAERTAHELALRDAAVLIGCGRAADVPEPLRRIADLVLTFPRIDRGRFARIFERVFHARPMDGWDAPGTDWTRYLVPADFQTPRRLGLSPGDALFFLRERVEDRLALVVPDVGPRLDELHGLGEARQICEDLIADIRAAEAGEIPWSAVDKGMLLVGAPGTGKTTLARAVARECGIKFVSASAARWQAAGALDAHLSAMRADFAEARRYAPAILFLDEIDSIGSREQIGADRNVVYQTEVINALLEQIQGIQTVDPVIVIGATNYPENVDPALRRAGRLDQLVRLSLPSIASLEQIYAYYLASCRERNEVARGVNMRSLAELSFGLTGADVELFVRGAARRARHARRKIRQEDLVAEITHRPRRADSAPRLGPDELRRVAVHEAGHALARLISSTQGVDLSFVTVIPRMDGSLGFVAAIPSDSHVATRRTMLEELETVLAGRAAEEVVFGADDVGAGAGGPSRGSDLAVATRLATLIVCQSGLGDDGALHWTEEPTAAQERQIDALLGKAYAGIGARLEAHRALLDEIVALLEKKQEIAGSDLRRLLARSEQPAAPGVASP